MLMWNASTILEVRSPLLGLTLFAAASMFLVACAASPASSAVPAAAGGTVSPSVHPTISLHGVIEGSTPNPRTLAR